MFTIEVKEYDPGPGLEYTVSSYPADGVYWNERLRTYFFRTNGSAVVCILSNFTLHTAAVELVSTPTVNNTAIDIARILAVAMSPAAALAFISKE